MRTCDVIFGESLLSHWHRTEYEADPPVPLEEADENHRVFPCVPSSSRPESNRNRSPLRIALADNIDPSARDPASGRSQLKSFSLISRGPATDFFAGTLLAYGIRNPAGFAFWPPRASTLWTVENGASIDAVPGITPPFANDNPADELERVELGEPAKFYGFPDCTTLWNGSADPVGEPQFVGLPAGAQFSLNLEPARDNAWCRNASNNAPPRLSFQVSWHTRGFSPTLTYPVCRRTLCLSTSNSTSRN